MSDHPSRYPAQPIADRLAILAVAVTQFLVGHGRVWTKPFDWDRSILWSYATIAFLVFADLAVRRRLHPLGWFLHTLELSAVAAVQTGQPLSARSANHELLTLLLTQSDRSWVMNVPLLASGQSRTIRFDDARGLVAVRCMVHGSREGEAHLAILDRPFFAFIDVDGHFVLQRIPSGNLTISAFHPAQGESSAPARLGSGEKLDASLSFGGR